MRKHFKIEKRGGDDEYSWAVVCVETKAVVATGCCREEAEYHKRQLEGKELEKDGTA